MDPIDSAAKVRPPLRYSFATSGGADADAAGVGIGDVAAGGDEGAPTAVAAIVVATVAVGDAVDAAGDDIRAASDGKTSAIATMTYSAKPTRSAVFISLARGHAPDLHHTAANTRIEHAVQAA